MSIFGSIDLMKMSEKNRFILQFVKYTVPIYIANLIQQLYYATDTLLVGRLINTGALAAIGSVACISYMIVQVSAGVSAGYTVLFAQARGENSVTKLRRIATADILSSFVFSLFAMMLLFVFDEPIYCFLSIPGELVASVKDYMNIIYVGIPITVFNNLFGSFLRSLGDSKTPSIALVISVLINISLDILFIKYFAMGVRGAALATIMSQLIATLICYIKFKRKNNNLSLYIRGNNDITGDIIAINKIGIPYALQFVLTSLGIMVVQKAVNSCGKCAIAGFSIAGKLHAIVAQGHVSLGMALLTFTAIEKGQTENILSLNTQKDLYPLFLLCSVISALILKLFGTRLSNLFLSREGYSALEYASIYINSIIWFYPVLSSIFWLKSILVGIGFSSYTLIASVVELLTRAIVSQVIAPPGAYRIVCFSDPIAWVMGCLMLFALLKKEQMRSRNLDKLNKHSE